MYRTSQEEIGKVVETLKTLEKAIATGKMNDTLVRTIILSVINDLELPEQELPERQLNREINKYQNYKYPDLEMKKNY